MIVKNAPVKGALNLQTASSVRYSEIALTGQVPAQEPHSMHLAASMCLLPSTSLIAPTGQEDSQAPQLMQTSGFTL